MPLSKVTSNSLSLTTLTASGAATLSNTLAVTGVATFSTGTAALPSITTTGDPDTGIYFPSANTIGFTRGGIEVGKFDSNSANANFQFNSGYGSVATAYGCRAWVNFNGSGTVAIRASGNVQSITDNGTGDYTVTFTTAMPDVNYVANVTGDVGGVGDFAVGCTRDATARTTSLVRISVGTTGGASADSNVVAVAVFR